MPDATTLPKKPKPPAPCRLYAILAREAPVGVIFRRGPSRWYQIIRWDTATDIFTPGQWLHGRIYERRSDVSPNGELLIYCAQKYSKWGVGNGEYTHAWTAISKPPYLTALALWSYGYMCVGSGLFLSDSEVWLNEKCWIEQRPDPLPPGIVINSSDSSIEGDLFFGRLERDGWRHIHGWHGEESEQSIAYRERILAGTLTEVDIFQSLQGLLADARSRTHIPGIYEKLHPDQEVTLVMTANSNDLQDWYDYKVQYDNSKVLSLKGVEWADWDKRGRLVYAHSGKIFALAADAIGKKPPTELADLNGNKFEEVVAPDWAKHL